MPKAEAPKSKAKNGGLSPKGVMSLVQENRVQAIDFRFVDLIGQWQHFTASRHEFSEDAFEEGLGFDGSSIRGFQEIQESDMLLMPDPSTAFMDPFTAVPTLVLICNVKDPVTGESYTRDPRYIAMKAESYLKSTGIADTAYFGPEPEFFILDDVRFSQSHDHGFYYIDSSEGFWNSGRDEKPNLGYKPRYKEGYFPVPPMDSHQDIRTEMMLELEKVGVRVEIHHHEVATAGQCEIGARFNSLVKKADELQIMKYVIHNVAHSYGKTVTFMPKPLVGDNGSGMHVHQSIFKDGANLFSGNKYGGLSDVALYYIGGIIKHAKALNAITNASTNSYKRLVPGFEAPVMLAYSARNRSASIRIPHVQHPKGRRIEVRFPDNTANPYLAFTAMMMAGLDGIQNKIHPGEAMDKDLYDLPPEEEKEIPKVCHALDMALEHLDSDRAFLKAGGVFTDDVIDAYIAVKMDEVTRFRMTAHPVEFDMYYSC